MIFTFIFKKAKWELGLLAFQLRLIAYISVLLTRKLDGFRQKLPGRESVLPATTELQPCSLLRMFMVFLFHDLYTLYIHTYKGESNEAIIREGL